jgi:DNA topoisomerase IA
MKNLNTTCPKDIQDHQHVILRLLLKKLEELGIGRPSTYVQLFSIINRNYVEKGNLDGMKGTIHN